MSDLERNTDISHSEEQEQEIRDAFALFDTDDDGCIDARELSVALRALEIDVAKDEIASLVGDARAPVGIDEFIRIAREKMAARDPDEELRMAFALFDADGKGKVTLDDLKRVSNELCGNMTDDALAEMIKSADSDGDSEISYEDFVKIIKK